MKTIALLAAIGLIVAVGCGQTATVEDSTDNPLPVEITTASLTLCKDCGEVKGTDKCCAEGAAACDCGFHKGSLACCKVDKTGEDITLCTECGFVVDSKKCCADGAEVCECGFAHGSPACCKVEKEALAAADGDDHDRDGGDHDDGHDEQPGHDNDSDA